MARLIAMGGSGRRGDASVGECRWVGRRPLVVLPSAPSGSTAAGDLDPITKLPFGDELLQPCTAPLGDDAPAGAGGAAAGVPSGRQPLKLPLQAAGHGRGSGRGLPRPGDAAAANGGNTIGNYFARSGGLSKPSGAAGAAGAAGGIADFKPPRPGSSQDSLDGRDQQQPVGQGGSDNDDDGLEAPLLASPPSGSSPHRMAPGAAGAGDTLASPTEEQWEAFRRRRQKPSGKAAHASGPPEAAPGAGPLLARQLTQPAAAPVSRYFAPPAAAVDLSMGKQGVQQKGGGLLARLQAALAAEEPSVDELLR